MRRLHKYATASSTSVLQLVRAIGSMVGAGGAHTPSGECILKKLRFISSSDSSTKCTSKKYS